MNIYESLSMTLSMFDYLLKSKNLIVNFLSISQRSTHISHGNACGILFLWLGTNKTVPFQVNIVNMVVGRNLKTKLHISCTTHSALNHPIIAVSGKCQTQTHDHSFTKHNVEGLHNPQHSFFFCIFR